MLYSAISSSYVLVIVTIIPLHPPATSLHPRHRLRGVTGLGNLHLPPSSPFVPDFSRTLLLHCCR